MNIGTSQSAIGDEWVAERATPAKSPQNSHDRHIRVSMPLHAVHMREAPTQADDESPRISEPEPEPEPDELVCGVRGDCK